MPTANRRRFAPYAIASFLAQDYPNAELVILDDGEDGIADLAPDHPRVRYLRAGRHRDLGEKRNAACEAARGDILLHWDDDDWYAPHRVSLQVDALLANGARLCGLDRVLFYDPSCAAAWEYNYPPGGAPWAYGATLAYRRDYWREHPFPHVTIGEDNAFTAAAGAGELRLLPDNRFFVGLMHAANTSFKNIHDSRWRRYDVESVRALTGPGWPDGDTAAATLPGVAWRADAFAASAVARAPCEARQV
jgi:glycosyltransferase involved in cell wall biosynthesis